MTDSLSSLYSFIGNFESKGRTAWKYVVFPTNVVPNHEVVYIRRLLEDRFTPTKFTLKEVEGLVRETYVGYDFENHEELETLIPKWFADKWLNRTSKLESLEDSVASREFMKSRKHLKRLLSRNSRKKKSDKDEAPRI